MTLDIAQYNAKHESANKDICIALSLLIERYLPTAQGKVWHGGPVWFIAGNPIVGYWVRKKGVQLLFWSGQSFDADGLEAEGKFKAAQKLYFVRQDIVDTDVAKWLEQASHIQWDYKNIVKRRGVLEKIGAW